MKISQQTSHIVQLTYANKNIENESIVEGVIMIKVHLTHI
jgi:hypothetical protein